MTPLPSPAINYKSTWCDYSRGNCTLPFSCWMNRWTIFLKFYFIAKIDRYLTLHRTNDAADSFVAGVRRTLKGSTLVGYRVKQSAVCVSFSTVNILRKLVYTDIFHSSCIIFEVGSQVAIVLLCPSGVAGVSSWNHEESRFRDGWADGTRGVFVWWMCPPKVGFKFDTVQVIKVSTGNCLSTRDWIWGKTEIIGRTPFITPPSSCSISYNRAFILFQMTFIFN